MLKDKLNLAILGLVILIAVVGGLGLVQGQKDSSSGKKNNSSQTLGANDSKINTAMNKVKIDEIKVGDGKEATNGAKITVNYRGTLGNGKQFDSSYDRNQPFSFTLGAGQVIEGWDQGLLGMKVGGKRKLTIPSELGYGSRGAGPDIPPNSTLIFEVELLGVE